MTNTPSLGPLPDQSGDAGHQPVSSHPPLSDEQLNHFFAAGRPVPPPDWQARFWQDLEPKLTAEPVQADRSPRIWLRRPPVMAAAAAFVVLLIALPITRQLARQEQLAYESTTAAHRMEGESRPGATAPRADAPPMTYGAAVPEEPALSRSAADSTQNRSAGDTASKRSAGEAAPGLQDKSAETDAAGQAANAGRMAAEAPAAAPVAPQKAEQNTAPADATVAESLQQAKESESLREAGFGQDTGPASPGQAQAPLQAESKLKQQADPTAQKLQTMFAPYGARVRTLASGRYEIRLPLAQRKAFKARLGQWRVPHSLLEQALHERQEVIYRLELQ